MLENDHDRSSKGIRVLTGREEGVRAQIELTLEICDDFDYSKGTVFTWKNHRLNEILKLFLDLIDAIHL